MGKLTVTSNTIVDKLDQGFWEVFKRATAAHRCGITVYSAWRSWAKQAYLYTLFKLGKGNPANKPGTSLHEVGLAVDARPDDGDYKAMQETLMAFGIVCNKPKEPWHCEGDKNILLNLAKNLGFPVAGAVLLIGGLAFFIYSWFQRGQPVRA